MDMEKFDVDVDYHVKRAKQLCGEKISDVDVEYIVKQAYDLVRPRTDEERAEIKTKMDRDLREFIGRQRATNRMYTERVLSKIQVRKQSKRFFGIKIGWFFE